MKSPFTHARTLQIAHLFDYCFKRGVIEAYDAEDDAAVMEWYEERKKDGGYGLISDMGLEYDWRRWRFTLLRWCRIAGIRTLGEDFIDGLKRDGNILSAVFPFCMRFYLLGVKEWLDYPNQINIEYFRHNPRIHWTDNGEKFYNNDYIVYLHEFTYEAIDSGMDPARIKRLDGFAQAMWSGFKR